MTGGRFHLLFEKTFLSKNYKGLENILEDLLKGQRNIASACFGVAGPVTQEVVIATNLPWWIETQSLQKMLPFKKVEVINDLVANAYGISALKKNDFEILSAGKIKKGESSPHLCWNRPGRGDPFLGRQAICTLSLRGWAC